MLGSAAIGYWVTLNESFPPQVRLFAGYYTIGVIILLGIALAFTLTIKFGSRSHSGGLGNGLDLFYLWWD